MDVGCGAGVMLRSLSQFGDVSGMEVDTSMLDDTTPFRSSIHTEPLGADIYRDMRFDLITCLDVIEHIDDDGQAVTDMMRMLRPGGTLLVTVPAFMALWDEHDEMNRHYRRYTTRTLRDVLAPHGQITELRYLFTGLFLPKLAVRQLNRLRKRKIVQSKLPGGLTNRVMKLACEAEYRVTRRLRPPFGTSVLAVVRKPLTVGNLQPAPLEVGTGWRQVA